MGVTGKREPRGLTPQGPHGQAAALPGGLAHGVTSQLQIQLDDTCFPCPRAEFLLTCSTCVNTKGHASPRVKLRETPINAHWLMHEMPTCSWPQAGPQWLLPLTLLWSPCSYSLAGGDF